MARKKRSKKKNQDVEKEFYEEIEFDCPVRGKVKQKVKVKKLKSKLISYTQLIKSGDELGSIESSDDDVEDSEDSLD